MQNPEVWATLGQRLFRRRIELGYPKRSRFAEATGFGNDRVLYDLENGRRSNYSVSTLLMVERAYEWPPGSIEAFLQRGIEPPATASRASASDQWGGEAPPSAEEVAGRLAAVSKALRTTWERRAETTLELEQAKAAVTRLQQQAEDLTARCTALEEERQALSALVDNAPEDEA